MSTVNKLCNAYYKWRVENEISDHVCASITITPEFRTSLLHDEQALRGAYWQQSAGRVPVEYFMGCPLICDSRIESDYQFKAEHELSFSLDPYSGNPHG